MPKFDTVITDDTFILVVEGVPYSTDRSNMNWERIKEALNDPGTEAEDLINLMSPAAGLTAASADFGEIEIVDGFLYFNGVEVHSALSERIIDIFREGLPLQPWVKFAENVYANPDTRARDELYLWLEKSSLPITTDGHFLAYKKVTSDFLDIYTRSMDNSPGKVVSMPRENVDANRDRTCSQGLHFCSKEYLPHFGVAGSDTVVVVKVNPADVVSIPSDYDNAKGRTWRYEVLYEFDGDYMSKAWRSVESTTDQTVEEYAKSLKEAEDDPEFEIGHRVILNDSLPENEGSRGWISYITDSYGTKLYDVVLDSGEEFTLYSYEINPEEPLTVDDVYATPNGIATFAKTEAKYAGFEYLIGGRQKGTDLVFHVDNIGWGKQVCLRTDLAPSKKTKKDKKKDKKLATKNKNKKAVTINTLELGTLSRKQFKQAVKQHGSVAAWARSLGVPAGTVGKWKARLWPKETS